MISEELKAIIDKLKEQGNLIFLEGATEEQITQFEKDHEIELPEKYKEWLQYSDGGELFLPAGVQFYGVAHKPIIDVDENDRPDEKYIVIGALASGDPVESKDQSLKAKEHVTGRRSSKRTFLILIKEKPTTKMDAPLKVST